jgi:amidophosphoribosyltransferase
MVMGVPDSATAHAIGYAEEAGIPFGEGLIKNRYIGRTFIQPDDRLRQRGVALKYNTLPDALKGKRIVLVDDSIVRGNTSGPILSLLRQAGAAEIHMRVASPPLMYPCFMGVDMATREELIAASKTVDEIAACIGADTLRYLSLEGIEAAVNRPLEGHCTACFSGDYPLDLDEDIGKHALEA